MRHRVAASETVLGRRMAAMRREQDAGKTLRVCEWGENLVYSADRIDGRCAVRRRWAWYDSAWHMCPKSRSCV